MNETTSRRDEQKPGPGTYPDAVLKATEGLVETISKHPEDALLEL